MFTSFRCESCGYVHVETGTIGDVRSEGCVEPQPPLPNTCNRALNEASRIRNQVDQSVWPASSVSAPFREIVSVLMAFQLLDETAWKAQRAPFLAWPW
jgi:hypothetical protein